MTRLYNDPARFAEELREGFVAANRSRVRDVPGGVARATASATGSAAVVIGGGSGHYPAFAGLVGAGLASGAAMGDLFASPSAQRVESVARASDHGGGVLLACGNYAGDVLNFTAAAEALRAGGIDTRCVFVTDDIASASAAERAKRRGLAGGLVVYKIAAAAADRGDCLDEVERLARRANERTRTLGVAFSGCTLPGAAEPLFTVPAGRMAVGMGIHGEPGISETSLPTADELAALLVDALLAELPDDLDGAATPRAALILNGLGTVKYEELFVVYRRIALLLHDAGIEVVEPEVGEFCTSFDMAGCSLTLCWLDDELEELWAAPADSPAFRKGAMPTVPLEAVDDAEVATLAAQTSPGSAESRAAVAVVIEALAAAAAVVDENVDDLGRIDAIAGDGDHGVGMQRGVHAGLAAAHEAAQAGAGAGTVLARAAAAWSDRAGGTSGMLWGIALAALGTTLGDDAAPTPHAVDEGVTAGVERIRAAGGAQIGDKTMVDAMVPFATALHGGIDAGLADAWAAAAEIARVAADRTADLVPQRGRSRSHGDKSLGIPDPGAHSFALIVEVVATVLNRQATVLNRQKEKNR